jgi:glutathione synthase/RimK-type ligase-like ATP-grasp enzyme
MNQTISLITYSDMANLDPDDRLLEAALERRGCRVQALVWDDEQVDWSTAGICILRSTWDYHKKFDRFSAWLTHVSSVTAVLNTPELVFWSCRKTYLKDLSDAGLPVIKTRFLSRANGGQLAGLLAEMGWREAIIKPIVGLATSGVKKIDDSPAGILAGEEHLHALLSSGQAMVQEYLPSVHDYGERALVFIDGKFSHCVRKSAFQKLAMAGHEGETAAEAAEEELAVARQIISYLKVIPLYARVDLVRDKQERPLLLELELVEPSLFISVRPSAAESFADAVMARAAVLGEQAGRPSETVEVGDARLV